MKPEPLPIEKHATQTMLLIEERTGWTRQQTLTVFGAVALIVVICLGSSLIALGQVAGSQPTITFAALPTFAAADVLNGLKARGVSVSNVQTINLPGAFWKASSEIQFSVQRDKDKATFLLIGYDTPSQAGAAAFAARQSDRYKTYPVSQFSNVLLAALPESAAPLIRDVNGHLTQALIAPYRNYLLSTTSPH